MFFRSFFYLQTTPLLPASLDILIVSTEGWRRWRE